jgi:4,5-dihydroxyphthalate decarboxylase
MASKTLRIGTTGSFHSQPILAHAVDVPGLTYEAIGTKTIDECTMRALDGDFDVAEMSLATFVKVRETNPSLVGLPIFARKLVSQYAFCRDDATLSDHASLRGKRVAVPQYWLTAALWHRWYLQHAFGVDPADVVWCPLGPDRLDGMSYPKDHQIDWSLAGRGQSEVLLSGAADCFIFARRPLDMAGIRHVAADPGKQAIDLVKATGIVPATHVIVAQASLVQNQPRIAHDILDLFVKALKHGAREVSHEAAQFLPLGDLQQDRMARELGATWNHYGWKPAELAVRTFCDAAVRQGMVAAVDIDNCFLQLNPER